MSRYLEQASAIARRICRDAIWADACCNWMGPFADSWNVWDVRQRSFGADLYAGTGGIALFLASVAHMDDDRLIRKTAEGAARHACRHAGDFVPALQIGVYTGALGVSWALIRIGDLLGVPAWQERGLALLEHLGAPIADADFDVMAGYAGAIPLLLKLSRRFERPSWVDLAARWGDHLEHAAERSDEGWSWRTVAATGPAAQRNLTGFSHGAAGMGWAFVRLFEATNDTRYRHAAEEAFRYERACYSAEHENWPDFRDYLRPSGAPPAYGLAWCHGAPGIALSRLEAWRVTGASQDREEAETAVRTTRRALEAPGAAAGFSLCHGCAGNADVLLEADRAWSAPDLRRVAEQIGDTGVEQVESSKLPWPCGVPGAAETPCLMLGTAGIGYFYLRLADPDLPTVLRIG